MDHTFSPRSSNLQQQQATSTPTAPAPTARISCLPISPLTTTDSINESSVLLESSLEDISEEQLLDKFLCEGCGYRYGPKDTRFIG